jgi:hypothetical protein
MKGLNKVTLIGNLGADVELRRQNSTEPGPGVGRTNRLPIACSAIPRKLGLVNYSMICKILIVTLSLPAIPAGSGINPMQGSASSGAQRSTIHTKR